MSRDARDWAWGLALRKAPKLVLLALAECANEHQLAWPSFTHLQLMTGMARTTISRAIAQLVATELVDRDPSPARAATCYRLHVGASPTVMNTDPLLSEEGGSPVLPPNATTCAERYHLGGSNLNGGGSVRAPRLMKILEPSLTVKELSDHGSTRAALVQNGSKVSRETVPRDPGPSPGFMRFWAKYPRKEGERAAWEQWQHRLKGGETEANLIAAGEHIRQAFDDDESWEIDRVWYGKTFLGPTRLYEDWIAGVPNRRRENRRETSVNTTSRERKSVSAGGGRSPYDGLGVES